jgi:hypothetical protein
VTIHRRPPTSPHHPRDDSPTTADQPRHPRDDSPTTGYLAVQLGHRGPQVSAATTLPGGQPGQRGDLRLSHPDVMIEGMDTCRHTDHDDLPPLAAGGAIPGTIPIGTVVDRWQCPCCDRTIDIVHRPGRPRLYCSHACRQRAYRWRREHHAHTRSTPSWPAESATVRGGGRTHALRTERDPLSRRSDRRGREVTACGALGHPHHPSRRRGERAPFLRAGPTACRMCAALVQPRPLGLVPPGAIPPPTQLTARTMADTAEALRAISDDYPLDPGIRRLLTTLWAA